MLITKILQIIAVLLNIVLADDMKNICIQYLENIEILTDVNEQPFLNQVNTYYIGQKQEQSKLYCKDLKLWKYSNYQFNDPLQLQQLDNNQLLFEINDTKIVQYYAFTYKSQKIKFMVKSLQIELIQGVHQQRLMEETIPIESKLNFCSDSTCSIILNNPEIYLNDDFYLQQIVLDSNYTDYYLTNTTVYYVADSLNNTATIEAIDNLVKGRVIMLLRATQTLTELNIQVYSILRDSKIGSSQPLTASSTITTSFKQRTRVDLGNAVILVDVKMQVCSDKLCTKELDLKKIHYNDKIFAIESLTTPGADYYLTNTTVNLIENGQSKQNFPLSIDNSQRGKTIALLKVDVKWQITNITMSSDLSFERGIPYTYTRISASTINIIIMILLISFY